MSVQFIPHIKHRCVDKINTNVFIDLNTIVFMSTLATRLREARKGKKMSQEALAKRLGADHGSLIGNVESGRNQSFSKIVQAAEILGVNALWLAEGKGPKFPTTETTATQFDQLIDDRHPHYRVEEAGSPHYHVRAPVSQTETSPEHENQKLVNELLARRIPPHIQQSIMTLLQTCAPLESSQQLSEWDRMTAEKIAALRAAVPPEQQQVIDDFRDMFLHGYVQPGPKRDLIAVVSLDADAADHDADDDPGHAEDEKKKRPK